MPEIIHFATNKIHHHQSRPLPQTLELLVISVQVCRRFAVLHLHDVLSGEFFYFYTQTMLICLSKPAAKDP